MNAEKLNSLGMVQELPYNPLMATKYTSLLRSAIVVLLLFENGAARLQAQSVMIPASSVISTSPGIGSNQLVGTLFTFPAADGSSGMATILAASTDFGTFTYTSGSIFSTSSDTSTTISTFLGSDAASFSGNTTIFTTHDVVYSGITLSGYIYVPASAVGTAQTFSFSSDDGSNLIIGGSLVLNNDGIHPVTTKTANAIFSVAGLYSYSVNYYDGEATQAYFSATLPTILQTYTAVPEPSKTGAIVLIAGVVLLAFKKGRFKNGKRAENGAGTVSLARGAKGSKKTMPRNARRYLHRGFIHILNRGNHRQNLSRGAM